MKICIFEPSSPSHKNDLNNGLKILKKALSKNIKDIHIDFISKDQKPNDKLPYISSDDDKKKDRFEKIFQKQVDIVFLTRGGYGCYRWISKVNWREITTNSNAKNVLVIGFSDATFLACALIKNKMKFLHAPMISTLQMSNSSSIEALSNFISSRVLPKVAGTPFKKGEFQGELIGGNLTCLCHTIGTELEPNWNEKILFLEDVNEDIYKIDRMFTHLEMTGAFNKIGALCLGEFIFPVPEQKKQFPLLLEDKFSNFNKPVIFNLPCGHGNENMPLLFGQNYKVAKSGFLIPI